MTIGRRADTDEETIERAARLLAGALGYGSPWFATTIDSPYVPGTDNDPKNHALTVCSPGLVTEQAAWSVDGSRHVRRQRAWRQSAYRVATPVCKPRHSVLAALSLAKLDGPLESVLFLYVTGDVGRFWPDVERFGLACVSGAFASEALNDAMERIMFRRASISQDARAKTLGIRASGYRAATRAAEVRLRSWLLMASRRLLVALG
ncbi:hypothetical protein J2T07_002721 [Luteibacter jiangsuensis]|uniref:Uncharacterized protein n=1 Tax=Luteibacter jiangsuensis TaxID=637577 RepID=A0ABT9SZV1_9GAMM|nr:hypothetical protein [Luteibacter jiangsuensis]